MTEMRIGDIASYYGGLYVKESCGSYYWSIEDWDCNRWEEIPKHLYDALIKFESERKPPGEGVDI